MVRVSLGVPSSTNIKYLKEELDDACTDAEHLRPDLGRHFGICFTMVCVPKKSVLKFELKVKELQKEIVSANFFDAIAWCFPQQAGKLSHVAPWDTYFYPGSILLMREA